MQDFTTYYAGLPKRPVAGAVLLFDEIGNVLTLEPTYRSDGWMLPGGTCQQHELPSTAAKREAKEEIGLVVSVGRCLMVDICAAGQGGSRMDTVICYFDGPILTKEQVHSIVLPPNELRSHKFVSESEAVTSMTPRGKNRLAAALEAKKQNCMFYLENNKPLI